MSVHSKSKSKSISKLNSQGVPFFLHRSGKVPKFFKMIPQYRNWEELLCITQPDEWSAAAVFRATRIFTSGLKTNMAQRFFNQGRIR